MYEKNFTFENNKKVINVGVGEYVISKDEILTIIGLGSCIAIALYDERKCIGGLGHAMLPKYNDGKDKIHVGKYADTLVYLLVDGLVERGASKSSIKAKLVGGAQMFSNPPSEKFDIGRRNISSAKETLEKERIQIVAEDTGGNFGRTVNFRPWDGLLHIQAIGKPAIVL